MDKAKQSCKEFQKIAANFGLSTKELIENLEQLQKPDFKMEIRKYEIQEAMNWLRKNKDNSNTISQDLAEYGRRLYNQAINDAVNTIRNTHEASSIGPQKHFIERIKKLER